jgi:hypothetical protein
MGTFSMFSTKNWLKCTFLCLSFLVNDHKRKQKVLGPNQKLKFNPTELIIYCKDFRIVRFRFDESGPESAKKVITVKFYQVLGTVLYLPISVLYGNFHFSVAQIF